MSRNSASERVQTNVLLKSRRRCSICFGLNRDTAIKQGQIAHIDKNPANNEEGNLVFLCFDHHDQYDSTTRQGKNLTSREVKEFRQELLIAIDAAFGNKVLFGEAKTKGAGDVSGHYIRDGEFDSAEVKVNRLRDGRYHVEGFALWGKTRKYGPNIGELSFVGDLMEDTIKYESDYPDQEPYRAHFTFKNGELLVSENDSIGQFGLNVYFEGRYHIVE